MKEQYLTAPEAAALLSISERTFYRRIKAGLLPASVPVFRSIHGWLRTDIETAKQEMTK